MDHPHPVTWTPQVPGLSARRSKTLHSAVSTAEHCLALWGDFLTAATPQAVGITVTVTDDTDSVSTVVAGLDAAGEHVALVVPLSALEEHADQLAARMLDAVIPALVTIAEQHPRPEPVLVWYREQVTGPQPDDEPGLDIALDHLDDEVELVLIGRLDGTPGEEPGPHHRLDDYIDERLECRGIAGRADSGVVGSAAYRVLELFPESAG
ncbi:hypothetical protein ACWEOZ_25950 [Actinoplanes sp. NPDC004185]